MCWKRLSFVTSQGPRLLDIFCECPFEKINYRNMLWCLMTGESYHIAQGGFWGNSVTINQPGVISPEIVSMQISVTFVCKTVSAVCVFAFCKQVFLTQANMHSHHTKVDKRDNSALNFLIWVSIFCLSIELIHLCCSYATRQTLMWS